MRKTTLFKQLINDPEILLLPGIHDVLSARIGEAAGFKAMTGGGYSASATLIGQPDTSQLSLTEMADHYSRICDCIEVPFFGDGDTGFGNVTNVARTVRAYERAGLAGMFIEDQVFPKRCGHMAGKDVIPAAEMIAKLKAALDARRDPDFVIMARTDANAVNGLDDALERMALYREAGADLLFVEAPRNIDEMRRICTELNGPNLANMIEGGATPVLPLDELARIGFAAVTYPVAATFVVAKAMQAFMAHMAKHGTSLGFDPEMLRFDQFNEIIGLKGLRDREEACLTYASRLMANDNNKDV
ncbi:Methylisocitrate lyase [hydrothermal vent metagenome]|uniref:Methylisocitrate lyase n=1 Tax=hydrothermal vent metagenome TaxID=652676 RepID=A0A3B0T205_9ZZZZ